MKNGFAEALREHLAAQKKSLREVARGARMDPSFLSKLLLGQRNPPADEKRIEALARALGMDATRLCFLAGRIPERLKPLFQKASFLAEISRHLPSAPAGPKPGQARGPAPTSENAVAAARQASFSELTEDLL